MSGSTNPEGDLEWRAEHSSDWLYEPEPWDDADPTHPDDALFTLQSTGEAHSVAAVALEGLSVRTRMMIADQYAAIAAILTDAAACPDPWVGPDPTLDPLWRDPQDRSPAQVRAERRDVAERAAVLDLSVRLGLSEAMIRRRAHDADTLRERCPRTWAAFCSGGVSEQNAGTAAQHAATLPAEAPESWAAFDDAVEHAARTQSPGRFRLRARIVRERVHPEHIDVRHERAKADRTMWLTGEPDGMATLSVFGSAVGLHRSYRRIDAQARHLHAQPDEQRTLAQLRADVAMDLLLDGDAELAGTDARVDAGTVEDSGAGGVSGAAGVSGMASGKAGAAALFATSEVRDAAAEAATDAGAASSTGVTPCATCGHPAAHTTAAAPVRRRQDRVSVAITVPVMTLLGEGDEPATLDGYGPIDTETARRLAGEASSWVRILTHPVTGTVLDVDRKTYRVPKALRRWLGVRDPMCIGPGCMRLARDCDIDHRLDWQYGGTTSDANLAPLCHSHHVVKTKSKTMLYRDETTGARWWVTPTHLTVPVEPAPF
ncbi:HNH endonuclease signature motif containing protein [Microbacterium jejuense]|uniref:HNH endonuclease signature motif containing protein n=1 Tax=Microbacterium jejuense TaxID=1263637 RepID=UPI0031E57A18